MRIEPPWSPPSARSTWPAATSAALPLDEPPAGLERAPGLWTRPGRGGGLPPGKHRSSPTAFAAIVAPASSSLVTTVASWRGTYPSIARDPFIIGTPARAMLSLTATLRPARGPSRRVVISVVTYQAPKSLAPSAGHWKDRCG